MSILLINNFSGISSGSKIGLAGEFRMGRGLDCISDPDVLKISPASTKDSGDTVTNPIVAATTNTTNSNIYFLSSSGILYKKAGGVYSIVTTKTSGRGMGYFNGTDRVVFCCLNTEYTLNPTGDVIATGRSLNSAGWHPVECFLDKVFIGSGRELISTDSSGINYDSNTTGGGITVEYGQSIKCLKNIGDWLFIGCSSDNSSLAKYYLWDGVSQDYNYAKTLKGEDGINCSEVSDDGSVIISAGKKGHLYQLTGLDTTLDPIKTLPGIENDKTLEIFPQAMANYQGKILIGGTQGTSITAEKGVFSWASHSNQYSKTLNMDYQISTGTTTGVNTKVSCLLAANTTDLYICWRDGLTTCGIDLINGTGVQATARYESLIHDNGVPHIKKFYKLFKVNLAKALETGQVITIYYKKDRGSWLSLGTMDFSVDGAISEKTFKPSGQLKAKEMEVALGFTNSGTTGPEVDSIAVEFENEEFYG
jgi:hypothetical protein